MKKLISLAAALPLALMSYAVSSNSDDARTNPSDGFHVEGTRILDAKNNEFVMRGVNYSWAWQRNHEDKVIPAAKRIGCNAIRLQLSTGLRKQEQRPDKLYDWERCKPEELRRLIELCEENKLVAVFNTHDETGENDERYLMYAVDFWIEMKDILNEHLSTVILNISNEWYGNHNEGWIWQAGYEKAIAKLRDAGIRNMLMVDCAGWGQDPGSVISKGEYVVDADPLHNLVFSVHFYDYAGSDDSKVQSAIDGVLNINNAVPMVVGEFSYNHQGHPVAYEKILSHCFKRHIGYLAWSWTDNGEGAEACDLFDKTQGDVWSGEVLAENGRRIIPAEVPYGIADTSRECTVFDESVPAGAEAFNPYREGAANGDQNHASIDDDKKEPVLDDSNSTASQEVLLSGLQHEISSWDSSPYYFSAALLTADNTKPLRKGDEIKIHVSDNGGGQIQVYYENPSHTNISGDYIDLNKSDNHTFTVKSGELRDALNSNGFYAKGQNYKVNGLTVTRRTPIISGVETVAASTAAPFDFDLPYEIYTLDGRRTSAMLPGRLYILRQGSAVIKHLAR